LKEEKTKIMFNPFFAPLKKEEVRIIDGVVFGNELDLRNEKVLLSGFPMEISEKLQPLFQIENDLELFEEYNNPKALQAHIQRYLENNQKMEQVILEYYAELLPQSKQEKLYQLYKEVENASQQIISEFYQKKVDLKEFLDSSSKILGNFVYDEFAIFAGETRAQSRRYEKWKGKSIPEKEKIIDLFIKSFRYFLSGEYLRKDVKDEKDEKDEEDGNDSDPDSRRILKNVTFTRKPLESKDIIHSEPLTGWEREVEIFPEQNLGYWTVVYRASHPVVPEAFYTAIDSFYGNWDDIFHEIGAVHTIVLVGIGETFQVREEERVIEVNSGDIISTKRKTKYYYRIKKWVVANGAGSWFQENDRLTLIKAVHFSSEAAAEKYAKSSTPHSKDGKYYPVRACAYSVGNFTLNWVCHQMCNAFTRRKYSLTGNYYPSRFIYGKYSNFPWIKISRRKCPVYRTTQYGGVPGHHLHYHYMPPYGCNEPVSCSTFRLVEACMNRDGVGLRRRWNPNKSRWQDTYASIIDKPASAIGIPRFTDLLCEYPGWLPSP
jgi:hypothetical protein